MPCVKTSKPGTSTEEELRYDDKSSALDIQYNTGSAADFDPLGGAVHGLSTVQSEGAVVLESSVASVPVLTSVSNRGGFVYECQNQRDTRIFYLLVSFHSSIRKKVSAATGCEC